MSKVNRRREKIQPALKAIAQGLILSVPLAGMAHAMAPGSAASEDDQSQSVAATDTAAEGGSLGQSLPAQSVSESSDSAIEVQSPEQTTDMHGDAEPASAADSAPAAPVISNVDDQLQASRDATAKAGADDLSVIPVPDRDEPKLQNTDRQEGAGSIAEVVVTATKRATSLQETGIAVSVLNSDDLQFRQMKNVDDMQNSVPGLRVGSIVGTPLITIRGVGLNFISGLGNPGVATHYDGVYLPRTGEASAASIDLDRVEVLRGPQGTLYGRNATGGSVNFMSKRPTSLFDTGVSAGIGSYGQQTYSGYLDVPLVDNTLAARAYVNYDAFDGYGINESNGHKIGDNRALMGHFGLDYRPADSVDVYGSYTFRTDKGSYPYSTALTTVTSLLGTEFPADEVTHKPYNMKGLRDPSSDKSTDIGSLTVAWDVNDQVALKSITGYTGFDRREDSSAPEIDRFVVYIYRREKSKAISQEFNLTTKWFDDSLNVLLGAYYQRDKGQTPFGAYINLDELTGILSTPTGLELVFPPKARTLDQSKAVFLDGSWSIFDDLRFVFGGRFSDETRQLNQTFEPYISDTQTGAVVNSLLEPVTNLFLRSNLIVETCENEKNSVSFKKFNPKAGFEWDVVHHVMAYVQYQSGFKSGGLNTATQCNQPYKPEEVTSYEIGLKSTLLDGHLTLNAAAFNYDYKNYQVEKEVGFTGIIENAAGAKARGFELEGKYVPAHWLALDTQYSFLDARYTDYSAVDNFDNYSAIVATQLPTAQPQDLSGNRLSRSPKNTVNLGITFSQDIDKWMLGYARFRIEGFWSDVMYFREFNKPEERQVAYSTYNAFLSFGSTNDNVELSLFAKNIADTRYKVGVIPFDPVHYYGAYYAPPRTLGATLSVRF